MFKKVLTITLIVAAILVFAVGAFVFFTNQDIDDSELIDQVVKSANEEYNLITVRNIHIMTSDNNKYVYFERYNKNTSEFVGLGASAVKKSFSSYKTTKTVMNTSIDPNADVISCSIDNIFFGKIMDENVFKIEYYDAGGVLISSVKKDDGSDFFYFTIPSRVEANTYPQISSVIYDKEGNII